MKQQLNYLRHTFLFHSRIPTGKIDYSEEALMRGFRYFPLVGIVVGAVASGVFLLSGLFFPQMVAAILAVATSLLLTGAMHEDGFSDFFDAFGGAYTKERTLEIMKDSNIGAYGVLSLLLLLLLKVALLTTLPYADVPLVLIAMGGSARFLAVVTMRLSTYARNEQQRSKSLHLKRPLEPTTIIISLLVAAAPLVALPWSIAIAIVVGYSLLVVGMRRYTEHRIGGFTGDTLGALEQMGELYFLLVSAAFLSPTPTLFALW